MKIVVLDGYTLNPGDLSWDGLRALGACEIYDRTPPELVVERARGAEAVLTNKVVVGREQLAQLPELRYIGVLATGYNIVDTSAARERGIPVTNVPEYGTRSVAQMAFALLLELALHVGHHAQTVREGRWTQSRDFCYWDYPLIELAGKTMGLIGIGRIGRAAAELALAFGMTVLAHDVHTPPNLPAGIRMVDLETLLRESDVVSLHCPLTAENQGLINAERLALMQPTAFLINTSRGPLVVAQDLADALNSGRLAGAGVDVLPVEPPPADNPLLSAQNCLVTPHIAWATGAARARLMETVVENLRAFQAGAPQNVVNP
ncbi:MAG: D-2-hydroxyacid dehydrogenase [Armatimonadota bacterium]